MINLLSSEHQKASRRAYYGRVAAIGLFLLAGVLSAGALLLFPAYILLRVQSNALTQEENALLEAAGGEGGLSPIEVLAQANDRRMLLASYVAFERLTPILADVVGSLHGGVYIDSVQFDASKGDAATILLRGRADERNALVSFSRRVESLPSVSAVDLPVSSLANNTDLVYSMTLTLNGNE